MSAAATNCLTRFIRILQDSAFDKLGRLVWPFPAAGQQGAAYFWR